MCDGPSLLHLNLPRDVTTPFSVVYWVFVENTGETPLADVRVCDDQLLGDLQTAGFGLGSCSLFNGLDGCSFPRTIAPGATEMYTCQVIVPSRDAWRTFAGLDGHEDEDCYTNTAVASGRADSSVVCGDSTVVASPGCSSQVCFGAEVGACCCKGLCPESDGVCCMDDVTEAACDQLGRDALCAYSGDGTRCDDNDGSICSPRIPTVSEWGLVILTLLLLTAAKLRFGARVTADSL